MEVHLVDRKQLTASAQAYAHIPLVIVRQWCRPYQSGEVIVQNYNSLLTLAHLAEVSDGIMLVENNALHSTCQRLLNIQRPSFTVRSIPCKLTLPFIKFYYVLLVLVLSWQCSDYLLSKAFGSFIS